MNVNAPNPHALGAEAPQDTDGRLSDCATRVKVLAMSMYAIAHAEGDLGLPKDPEIFRGFGKMLDEVAEEIERTSAVIIAESNAREEARV